MFTDISVLHQYQSQKLQKLQMIRLLKFKLLKDLLNVKIFENITLYVKNEK